MGAAASLVPSPDPVDTGVPLTLLPELELGGGVGRPYLNTANGRFLSFDLLEEAGVVRIHLSGSGR